METMERRGHAPLLDALPPAPESGTLNPSGAGAELAPAIECPFHLVMGQLARAAVKQQVLHITGEMLPRADLVDMLDGWQQLYRLIRLHVCPATRVAPLAPAELDVAVDTALSHISPAMPPTAPDQTQARLRAQLVACAACESAQQCPLGPASRFDAPIGVDAEITSDQR